ncbi:MAG: hypothetical protein ACYC8W_07735 [Candidatus Tyrphobacter sp.]
MTTAWQTSALPNVPEVLVKFGKVRHAISVAVVETSTGFVVEARLGRKIIERKKIGYDAASLALAIERTLHDAAHVMLEGLL